MRLKVGKVEKNKEVLVSEGKLVDGRELAPNLFGEFSPGKTTESGTESRRKLCVALRDEILKEEKGLVRRCKRGTSKTEGAHANVTMWTYLQLSLCCFSQQT